MNVSDTSAANDPASPTSDEPGKLALLSWDDVSRALDDMLARSTRSFDVLDHSLALQDWGSRARCETLHRAAFERRVRIRMLIADGDYVTTRAPRLMNLLKVMGHRIEIVVSEAHEFPAWALAVADRQHALFRPNSVHSTGGLYLDNPAKSIPYENTFQVFWEQGGQRIFPESLGL